MSTDKSKSANTGADNSSAPPVKSKSAAPAKPKVAPLFRRIDWFTLVVVTVVVMIGYWLTLAPDLTLEDSGELATGSFYAGIPHPPGYPVWTLYTYLWANFIPFNNVAWRVALGGAFAGALACGLIGLVVSRGSSMMIEGIEGLKNIDRRWENAICIVSGFVAGTLLGFNGFMWSQSIIVEVYSFEILSLMGVLVPLMRWIYAPQQRRYLYGAFFVFGLCFTTHQTLIVAAMGLEVVIAASDHKLGRSLFLWNSIAWIGGLFLHMGKLMFVDTNPMVFAIFNIIGVASVAAYVWLTIITQKPFGREDWMAAICGLCWIAGASFYLYMALAGMSTPPMEWGYPRTVEGFMHALTRGQYEKTTPTELFTGPGLIRFFSQLGLVGSGIVEEFNWVNTLLVIVPFLFFLRMQKRERAWMIGLTAVYFCLSVLLVILLNPSLDRQSRDLTRVFFIASHVMIVIWIGYGLTLIAASMLTNYRGFRPWGLAGGAIGVCFALYSLAATTQQMSTDLTGMNLVQSFFDEIGRAFQPGQYGLPIFAGLLLLGLTAIFTGSLIFGREKPHLGLALALFAIMPLHSVMSHWADNEQHDHLFGYWFGHDMFTPPFVDKDGKLSYNPKERAELMKDTKEAKLIYPEMARNAVLYGGTDPGRFCPTYMIFCESFIPPRCKPHDPNFDRRDVYIITQNALADNTYLEYIRSQYNKSAQIQYDTPFFEELAQILTIRNPEERKYRTSELAKLAYKLLDKPFIALGNKIEKRRREEGVFPPKEIYIASPEDSQRCFQEYMADAQQRMREGKLLPGEDVHVVKDRNGMDRVQVSGQVAVMAINGLISKVMFDHNTNNEFYVEESFPLQWMYPHLTPFGIIMKVNRQKVPVLTEDILRRDHDFWSAYSERLIGNWITYDTSVQEIVNFVEKTYLRRDYSGFKGDRKFARDDQAQKAFSKLRSSIAGVYAWRLGLSGGAPTPPEFRAKGANYQRVLKEADFAFKQAFAFCPYSPEAVFRYVFVLVNSGRIDDAVLVVKTALKLDPNNTGLAQQLSRLEAVKGNAGKIGEIQANIAKLRKEWQANPSNLQPALNLAWSYFSIGQSDAGVGVLDEITKSPHVSPQALMAVAQYHIQTKNFVKLEETLKRLTEISPNSPEAWYDLAALKSTMGKLPDALSDLKQAIQLSNDRLATNKTGRDMRAEAVKDPRFQPLAQNAEFKSLTAAP